MHLVEDNLVGVANAPKSCDERQDRDDSQGQLVPPLRCCSFFACLYNAIQKLIGLVCCFPIDFVFVFLGDSLP